MLLQKLAELKESLHFLHVDELRDLANLLCLQTQSKKLELIIRIMHFIQTSEKLSSLKFPAISCSKNKNITFLPGSLMLRGAYKNDLKTRLFFKTLIGDYFHFTAFGIDWLNERWMEGRPPTYQEFADMWVIEYQRRKESPVAPRPEWAYINYVQIFIKQSPDATKKDINHAWKNERKQHKLKINNYIKKMV